MFKNLKPLLCVCLCAAFLLAGCGSGNTEQKETTAPAEATTQPPTTIPSATTVPDMPASPDSAKLDDGKIKLDNMKIKENLNEIESTLDNLLSYHQFLGTVYAKVGTDFEYLNANGVANKGAHINNSVYTRFYTGSVTKLVTAIAVMQLHEQNKLRLDNTLDVYFPDCAYAKNVTVKQLLTMTSGIPNYVDRDGNTAGFKTLKPSLQEKLDGGSSYQSNKAQILEWILSQPLQTEGEPVFYYSDSNFYLLGEIVAQVGGESYEDYVSAHIFQPLFMTKSGFTSDESTARSYSSYGSSGQLLYDGVGYSSLGFVTNVSDLLKLIDGVTSHQIISEKSLREITTDYGSGFGYGVFVNGDRVSCMGSVDAYTSKLSFTADKSQMFIALSNYAHRDPNYIHRLFRNYLLKFRNA